MERHVFIYVLRSLVVLQHKFVVRNISFKAFYQLNSVSIVLCILLSDRRMFLVFSASSVLVIWTSFLKKAAFRFFSRADDFLREEKRLSVVMDCSWRTAFFLFKCITLSIYLDICLSVCLSVHIRVIHIYLSISISIYVNVCIMFVFFKYFTYVRIYFIIRQFIQTIRIKQHSVISQKYLSQKQVQKLYYPECTTLS